jgi:hypothetical protein
MDTDFAVVLVVIYDQHAVDGAAVLVAVVGMLMLCAVAALLRGDHW